MRYTGRVFMTNWMTSCSSKRGSAQRHLYGGALTPEASMRLEARRNFDGGQLVVDSAQGALFALTLPRIPALIDCLAGDARRLLTSAVRCRCCAYPSTHCVSATSRRPPRTAMPRRLYVGVERYGALRWSAGSALLRRAWGFRSSGRSADRRRLLRLRLVDCIHNPYVSRPRRRPGICSCPGRQSGRPSGTRASRGSEPAVVAGP